MSISRAKYRAKRIDNGEWVYGCLIEGEFIISDALDVGYCNSYIQHIFECKCHQVDPETAGQFTGRQDKNRVDIFEGDVIQIHDKDPLEPIEIKFGDYDDGTGHGIFNYHKGFYLNLTYEYSIGINFMNDNTIILGNIHDNPELLEVAE